MSVRNLIVRSVLNHIGKLGNFALPTALERTRSKMFEASPLVVAFLGALFVLFGPGLSPASAQTVIGTVAMSNQPEGVCVNPLTNRIYAVNFESPYLVRVINGSNNMIITDISVGFKPDYCAINTATQRLYVSHTDPGSNLVTVINTNNNTVVTTIPVAGRPFGLGVNTNTNRIYVPGFESNDVKVIDGSNNTILATIPVGTMPTVAEVNPATNEIYVAESGDGTVSIIDGFLNIVTDTIPVGMVPLNVGVNPITNRIYVSNNGSDSMSVLDGFTKSVIDTIILPSASAPLAIGINVITNRIYVARADRTLTVIRGVNDTVAANVLLPGGPSSVGTSNGLGVNPITLRVYVSHQQANIVSVVQDSTM